MNIIVFKISEYKYIKGHTLYDSPERGVDMIGYDRLRIITLKNYWAIYDHNK